MFGVFDSGKPASEIGFNQLTGLGWKTHLFKTFEEASGYAVLWLGCYAPDFPNKLEINVPYQYNGMNGGDHLIIKEFESLFDAARASPGILLDSDQETHDHMLNVLPPKYCIGCFAMGEPVSTVEEDGKVMTTYYFASHRGGNFYIFYGTKKQAEEAFRGV